MITLLPSPYQDYYDFLAENVITPFYESRLKKLSNLRLNDVLKRKNPYLFKAKNIELAGELVKGIVDAHLSSQEETLFGELLENFAIHVSSKLYGGSKSKLPSVDLEFERDGIHYLVGIKSGVYWANADQKSAMKSNFKKAKQQLRAEGHTGEIRAVNGCIYGKVNKPLQQDVDEDKTYYKIAGQDFWAFISDDEQLYQEIIVPVDQEAREKGEAFKAAYSAKVNEMTVEFMTNFMTDNQIDWVKLVDYVSKRAEVKIKTVKGETVS